MVEWATFGNAKEEDELLQLWRQAYAMVDEAAANRQLVNGKQPHLFVSQGGEETIRIPNGLPNPTAREAPLDEGGKKKRT